MGCNCNKHDKNRNNEPKLTVAETIKSAGKWAFTVATAWGNYVTDNTKANIEAQHRALFCNSCSFKAYNTLLSNIPDSIKSIEGCYCSKCNCPLSAKLRSNGNCPLNLW